MKRGAPLARRTPLKAKAALKARSPLRTRQTTLRASEGIRRASAVKRVKSAKLTAYDAEFAKAKAAVRVRSRGYCEGAVSGVCTGMAAHCHHVRLRSQGGTNEGGNLLDLCFACHEWAHRNPADAARLGLIARRGA